MNTRTINFRCRFCNAIIWPRNFVNTVVTDMKTLYLEGSCPKCRRADSHHIDLGELVTKWVPAPSKKSGTTARDQAFLKACGIEEIGAGGAPSSLSTDRWRSLRPPLQEPTRKK